MLYSLYQTAADMMLPMRVWATAAGQGLSGGGDLESWRAAGALCEMMSRAALTHRRPAFGITESTVGNRVVPVREEEVFAT
ncbi:MAG TPA: polyhydroxyalkanoate depolymerase, partial [Reyranella sp.]|nr:polyhydroxyalkanoate depolymerase [Reyranella sp.]